MQAAPPPAGNERGLLLFQPRRLSGETLEDAAQVQLISFRVCSLELTGMFSQWPVLPACSYLADKSSPGVITQAALATLSGSVQDQRFTLQPSCVFHLQAQVITPVLSPECVNGLQTDVFIFNTSGLVHIPFQLWKRSQGPCS